MINFAFFSTFSSAVKYTVVFLIASSIIILVQIFKTRYLKYYRDATMDDSNKNTIEVTNKKIIIREPKDGVVFSFIKIIVSKTNNVGIYNVHP